MLYQSASAMALASVVTTQIGNVLAQKTEHRSIFEIDLFTNRLIVLGIVTELAFIFMRVYVPFFQQIFTATFPHGYWLFLFALVPVLLIAEESRKGIVSSMERKKDPKKLCR